MKRCGCVFLLMLMICPIMAEEQPKAVNNNTPIAEEPKVDQPQETLQENDPPKAEEAKVVGQASQEAIKTAQRKEYANYAVAAFAVGGAILGIILIAMHGKNAHHSH